MKAKLGTSDALELAVWEGCGVAAFAGLCKQEQGCMANPKLGQGAGIADMLRKQPCIEFSRLVFFTAVFLSWT